MGGAYVTLVWSFKVVGLRCEKLSLKVSIFSYILSLRIDRVAYIIIRLVKNTSHLI